MTAEARAQLDAAELFDAAGRMLAEEIETDSDTLIAVLDYARSAADRLAAVEAERDAASKDATFWKAETAHIARIANRMNDVVAEAVATAADEGDRAYFGSTNQLDALRGLVNDVDEFNWERPKKGAALPDLYADLRKLRAKLATLTAQAEADKARIAELEGAIANATIYLVVKGSVVIWIDRDVYDRCQENVRERRVVARNAAAAAARVAAKGG